MYQFYYADVTEPLTRKKPKLDIAAQFDVQNVRPAMWEEHCLECSAPACFASCPHFEARRDGRCRRFENGLRAFPERRACCGQGARVKFRPWGNMMTIIFPAMISEQSYHQMMRKNQVIGRPLRNLLGTGLPVSAKWQSIRTVEYIRRRYLRKLKAQPNEPDAFIFHGYSYMEDLFSLILEVFNGPESVFRMSITIIPGENLHIINKGMLSDACWQSGNLVKIYPENNLEAEIDLYWCDFVQGEGVQNEQPAEKVKCVVWDLDGTIWDGILIESDNPEKDLNIQPRVLATIRELDRRGILQSVASKNDREPAEKVLKELGLWDYFLYPQISWDPKSGAMKEIANSLNIGIDSLALVDDSVFERKEVESVWPQVRTYDCNNIEDLIVRPEFDVEITEEAAGRRLMYKTEEKRKAVSASYSRDSIAFLRDCNLRAELFTPEKPEEIDRCYELIARTNQLNMSGIKYTRTEFDQLLQRTDRKSFAVSCRDRFGSYGIVGFGQYSLADGKIVFHEYAMSCRVAEKYLESALFDTILKKEGMEEGLFKMSITAKNALLRRTLDKIGFIPAKSDGQSIEYSFGLDLLHVDIVEIAERESE